MCSTDKEQRSASPAKTNYWHPKNHPQPIHRPFPSKLAFKLFHMQLVFRPLLVVNVGHEIRESTTLIPACNQKTYMCFTSNYGEGSKVAVHHKLQA